MVIVARNITGGASVPGREGGRGDGREGIRRRDGVRDGRNGRGE